MCFVGIGNDRVHVETSVGCPAPNWKDSNAEAEQERVSTTNELEYAREVTHERGISANQYYNRKNVAMGR